MKSQRAGIDTSFFENEKQVVAGSSGQFPRRKSLSRLDDPSMTNLAGLLIIFPLYYTKLKTKHKSFAVASKYRQARTLITIEVDISWLPDSAMRLPNPTITHRRNIGNFPMVIVNRNKLQSHTIIEITCAKTTYSFRRLAIGLEFRGRSYDRCDGNGILVKRVHVGDECGSTGHYSCKNRSLVLPLRKAEPRLRLRPKPKQHRRRRKPRIAIRRVS